MSYTQRLTFGGAVEGGDNISGSQIEVGSATNSYNGTFAANTDRSEIDWSITVANIQAIAILSTATMTLQSGGVPSIQTIGAITGGAGTFTLTYGGQTTSAIAYNAVGADVQAALRLLSTIGGSNVTVSGSASGPYTVTFAAQMGIGPRTAITGVGSGGATVGTITQTQTGTSDTINLVADVPLVWSKSAGYYSCPFTVTPIAKWLITCTQAARLRATILTS